MITFPINTKKTPKYWSKLTCYARGTICPLSPLHIQKARACSHQSNNFTRIIFQVTFLIISIRVLNFSKIKMIHKKCGPKQNCFCLSQLNWILKVVRHQDLCHIFVEMGARFRLWQTEKKYKRFTLMMEDFRLFSLSVSIYS